MIAWQHFKNKNKEVTLTLTYQCLTGAECWELLNAFWTKELKFKSSTQEKNRAWGWTPLISTPMTFKQTQDRASSAHEAGSPSLTSGLSPMQTHTFKSPYYSPSDVLPTNSFHPFPLGKKWSRILGLSQQSRPSWMWLAPFKKLFKHNPQCCCLVALKTRKWIWTYTVVPSQTQNSLPLPTTFPKRIHQKGGEEKTVWLCY